MMSQRSRNALICGQLVGSVSVDVSRVSDDPEQTEMLDDEHYSWDWRLVRPPAEWFGFTESDRDEATNDTDDMGFWLSLDASDVDAFLAARPIMADHTGTVIDGWHRLRAWFVHGLDSDGFGPPTLVGFRRGTFPRRCR